MKEWKELNPRTLELMDEFGNFGPTANPLEGTVKGYMLGEDGEGGKTYFDSKDLREFAKAFEEVAAWLEDRKITKG